MVRISRIDFFAAIKLQSTLISHYSGQKMWLVKSKVCIQCTTLPFVKMLSSKLLQTYQKKSIRLHSQTSIYFEKVTFSIVFKMVAFWCPQQYLACYFLHFNNSWSQGKFAYSYQNKIRASQESSKQYAISLTAFSVLSWTCLYSYYKHSTSCEQWHACWILAILHDFLPSTPTLFQSLIKEERKCPNSAERLTLGNISHLWFTRKIQQPLEENVPGFPF